MTIVIDRLIGELAEVRGNYYPQMNDVLTRYIGTQPMDMGDCYCYNLRNVPAQIERLNKLLGEETRTKCYLRGVLSRLLKKNYNSAFLFLDKKEKANAS